MSIRHRKDGDERPVSRIPFSGIGYYCVKCAKVHSLDRTHEASRSLDQIKPSE